MAKEIRREPILEDSWTEEKEWKPIPCKDAEWHIKCPEVKHNEQTKKALEKVAEAMKALEEIDPSTQDFFEDLGVLVGDVADMVYCPTGEKFVYQKSDCRKVIKAIKARLDHASFRNFAKEYNK